MLTCRSHLLLKTSHPVSVCLRSGSLFPFRLKVHLITANRASELAVHTSMLGAATRKREEKEEVRGKDVCSYSTHGVRKLSFRFVCTTLSLASK